MYNILWSISPTTNLLKIQKRGPILTNISGHTELLRYSGITHHLTGLCCGNVAFLSSTHRMTS